MIYIILCSVALVLWFLIDDWSSTGIFGKIGYFLLGSLAGIAIGFVVWVVVGSIIGLEMPKETVVQTKSLYALQDSNKISGRFYLMGGMIDEKPVIKYITDEELGKHIETQEVKNSYIKEGYSEPYLEIHERKFKEDWYWLFAFNIEADEYVFYVPSGSVINEYNIDLEQPSCGTL